MNANGVTQGRSVENTAHFTVTPKNQKSCKQTINAKSNGHENSVIVVHGKLEGFGWGFEISTHTNFS